MTDLTTKTIRQLFEEQVRQLTRRTVMSQEDFLIINGAGGGYNEHTRTSPLFAGNL